MILWVLLALAQPMPPTAQAPFRYQLSSGFGDPNGHNYTMDPGLVDLGAGRLCVCYSRAASHIEMNDVRDDGMLVRTSTTYGATWSAERPLGDTPMAADRGCGLSKIGTRVYASWTSRWNIAVGSNQISREVRWAESDDGCMTWSESYVIPATRTGTMLSATGGSTIEIQNGECITSYWDRDYGDQCMSAWALHAPVSDNGTCEWDDATASLMARRCTLNHNHYGWEFEEPALTSDPWGFLNGTLVAVLRVDTKYVTWPSTPMTDRSCYIVKSYDNGYTWTAPVFAFRCYSHPTNRVLADGIWISSIRDPTVAHERGTIIASHDLGVSWGVPIEYQNPSDDFQIYSGIIEVFPGTFGLVSSQQLGVSAVRSRTVFEIVSTYGM